MFKKAMMTLQHVKALKLVESHIMLPGGQTAGDWLRPQIANAYETGRMPPLLPALEGE